MARTVSGQAPPRRIHGFTASAWTIVGGLSSPSKMPGYAYSLPATECPTGSKLAAFPGTTCHKCYALRGRYNFLAVKNALHRRLRSLSDPHWVPSMSLLIGEAAHKGFPYFRWHDSGDLQSPAHLTNIILVAEATPHVIHWLPTRESLTVARVSTHTPIPRNLIIRVSATHVDSPPPSFNLTSTVTSDPSLATCPAPSQGGKCASCRQCWDPTVRNVAYALH